MFDVPRIRESIEPTRLEFHRQLASTNDRAIELAREGGLVSPSLILAERQSAGRGQRGNPWWSSNESLTCSWCFRRPVPVSKTGEPHGLAQGGRGAVLIPLVAAHAIAHAVSAQIPHVDLAVKWPNDLFVGDRKLAGILVETVAQKGAIDVVVGMGINVNQSDAPDFGASGDFSATSLRRESGGEILDMTKLLIHLVQQLERSLLESSIPDSDLVRWANGKLFRKGQKICFVGANNQQTLGILDRIELSGGLSLLIEGQSKTFFSGSIRLPKGE